MAGLLAIGTCCAGTLSPGEVLRYTFIVDLSNPASSSCIGACDALLITSNLGDPTGFPVVFQLFDGNTLLGQYVSTSDITCCVLGGFSAIGTIYDPSFGAPAATQVDFTAFQSSTVNGRVDISVEGGSVQIFDQTQPLITIGASLSPDSLDFFGTDPAQLTGSTLLTPEPSDFLPIGAGVLLMFGLREWRSAPVPRQPQRRQLNHSTRTSRRISCMK